MRLRFVTKFGLAVAILGATVTPDARSATLYAVTTTSLVRFSSDDPAAVTLIGNHRLPLAGAYGVNYLVYHPGQRAFFGLYYTEPQFGNSQQALFKIDPATGAGQFVADLGSSAPDQNYFESLEYVGSLQSLVVSRGPTTSSGSFLLLSPTGEIASLCSNGRDNDYTVFDSTRDLFYTIDPNGHGELVLNGVPSCVLADLGQLGAVIADMAYDQSDDAIYANDYAMNRLHRLSTTNGGAPFARTALGVIGTSTVRGLATIPPNCLADLNADGVVSTPDLVQFLGAFGGGVHPADFTGDGAVNTADLVFFLGRFGGVCQ